MSDSQIKAIKLALSLHIFSPKIEMFGQMASECGVPESRCPSAVDFNGRLFCHINEFLQYFNDNGKFFKNQCFFFIVKILMEN